MNGRSLTGKTKIGRTRESTNDTDRFICGSPPSARNEARSAVESYPVFPRSSTEITTRSGPWKSARGVYSSAANAARAFGTVARNAIALSPAPLPPKKAWTGAVGGSERVPLDTCIVISTSPSSLSAASTSLTSTPGSTIGVSSRTSSVATPITRRDIWSPVVSAAWYCASADVKTGASLTGRTRTRTSRRPDKAGPPGSTIFELLPPADSTAARASCPRSSIMT